MIFLPTHLLCGSAIGPTEKSIKDIHDKFYNDEYPIICARCLEAIELLEDICIVEVKQ